MSVITAIKKDGIVYMGCDSQVSCGGSRSTLSNPNNYKIWKVNDVPNCLMGSVGDLRDGCVVRIIHGLVSELAQLHDSVDYEYVVSHIMPRIVSQLGEFGYIDTDKKPIFMNSTFLFAYKDRLFQIGGDTSVIEIDDFVSVGSGCPEALGSLVTTAETNMNPNKRLIRAIKASVTHDLYVNYPIVISDTASCKFTVLQEDDIEKLEKRKEIHSS